MPGQFVAIIAVFIGGLGVGAWFGHLMAQDAVDEKIDKAAQILEKVARKGKAE